VDTGATAASIIAGIEREQVVDSRREVVVNKHLWRETVERTTRALELLIKKNDT